MLLAVLTHRWLKEHVAELEAPQRYHDSVKAWHRFYDEQRRIPADERVLVDPLTVAGVTRALVDGFVQFRRAEGASAPTISRDLAAVRGPINWGADEKILTDNVPRIRDVKGRKKAREMEWDPEQCAAILETAWADAERQHVHMFAMIMLSCHARVEATLELDADEQVRRNLIYFNAPDRDQTRKRRTIVPVCPTLAPWAAQWKGKVIVYRVPTAQRSWADPDAPEFFDRHTANIGNAFEGTLIAAHQRHPGLGLAKQKQDEQGNKLWLPPRKKLGETAERPHLVGIGTPNTLRHSIHTFHKSMGTIESQIKAAAGHSEEGTGANYTHIRPGYLGDFIEKTELFWEAVGHFTDVHLLGRSRNVTYFGGARA